MPNTVTVKSGDTLSQIAKQYGVNISDISGYRSGDPNLIFPGEVLNLSSVGSSIQASNIQPTTNVSLPTQSSKQSSGTSSLFAGGDSISKQVDKYRKQLDSMISNRKAEVDTQLKDLQAKEKETLSTMQTLTTPFREELENAQREKLHINENFEANQSLINELDTLLTQGNDLIKQQSSVTGLAAVRNPRIQKTMDDVASRAGVIEAVINARNGQISVAENLIDRSVNAIAADRQDQLSYYETVLNLNHEGIVKLDSESQKLADYQVSLIKGDMDRATETADYIKKLLVDPATASLMGEAGVTLKDSVETINSKLKVAQANVDLRKASNDIMAKGGVAVIDPSGVPADQLVTYVDNNGAKHYYKMPADKKTTTTTSTTVTKYKADASSIFKDVNTTATAENPNATEDKYLSVGEQSMILERIKQLPGMDETTAEEVFKYIWNLEGYQNWE